VGNNVIHATGGSFSLRCLLIAGEIAGEIVPLYRSAIVSI